ncbi:HAMP domain-containing histidine kinase [Agromyces intestinalis]|uniref:histidine kinase n=1 Tax=Agromyces intestinalis TaxID=2592652 RepID=A0A5C1YGX4_9MICO|nr:HAMP domain-containing sensor histidine kinase [Agromyces intestinalis]QEO14287.1 HAMP domain-containing histidine kinase [Agromyces intestinalis]
MDDSRPLRRRWSFRTRLTVTIAAIFVAAGVGLLAVQYLLVQSFFRAASSATICSEVRGPDASGPAMSTNCYVMTGTGLGDADHPPGAQIPREALEAAFDEYSGALSQDVLGSLLVASVVVLAVFAIIAVLLAGWLARRSLRRIAEVTELTRRITTDDLDRRLDLAGPDDEVKELGDTIDGMLDRLHTAFEAQDRFVQNASHELRTPLTVTRAALEIPLEQGRVPAELQPAVRRALAANAHSERLIGSLLVLARGRGRIDERVPVELGTPLAAAVAEVADEAAALGVEVSYDEPAAGATVDGDAQLLELAARNLLDNAVRYNDERGVVIVRIDAERPGFTVENTGRELGDAEVAALGEPFHRGEASRSADRDGYGLGLSIVRAVAAAHGGELVLRPRPGGGLVATLSLP